MKPNRAFDEVMIVNPYDPRTQHAQPIQLMRFHQPPAPYGYYAEPQEVAYYAEPPEPYGYYAESPDVSYYGEPADPYGYYAEAPEAPYGELPPEMGYYAEYPELPQMTGYAEPVAYYSEEYPPQPVAGYGQAPMPEMVGYHEYEPLSEDYSEVEDYGESDMEGYVRDVPPAFNPGCPLPSNVSGYEEVEPLQGYVQPADVSPTCPQFTPAARPKPSVPDTLKPLW
jgi:hypothetical protein